MQDLKKTMREIRLSVSESARIFGLSEQTVRRALKKNELSYIVTRGRYRISFESLLLWSQRSTTTRNKLAGKGIGQYVEQWKIQNKLYSPHPEKVKRQLSK